MAELSSWYKTVLEKVPHGEEGMLGNLSFEEATQIMRILVDKGYAVCMSGGDIGNEYRISWLYAGGSGDLNWADYNQVVFTHADFLDDYINAYNASIEADDEEDGIPDEPNFGAISWDCPEYFE